MTNKLLGHKIYEMALLIEQKGHDFYRNMAHSTTNVHLKDGYNWLANEERKHIKNFEQLRTLIEKIDTNALDNWDEVSLYFKALIDTNVFPDSTEGNSLAQELKDEIGAIHISISFEKDTILFLQELSRLVSHKDQKLIENLIEEEKSHISKLFQMKKEIVNL